VRVIKAYPPTLLVTSTSPGLHSAAVDTITAPVLCPRDIAAADAEYMTCSTSAEWQACPLKLTARRRSRVSLRGAHTICASIESGEKRLFIFGFGFSSLQCVRELSAASWHISGASTSAEKAEALRSAGVDAHLWAPDDGVGLDEAGLQALSAATHVLVSTPPAADFSRDPVLITHASHIYDARRLQWLGYLSSTSVYGARGGDWVDEDTPISLPEESGPGDKAGPRARAEAEWLQLGAHVFRLGGIYGPGRSAVNSVIAAQRGRAPSALQRAREGKRFTSRVHVDDIVAVLQASMASPQPGRIYNVVDDDPAPRHEVQLYAEALLRGEAQPPLTQNAAATPLVGANDKRVCNRRIKAELGVRLRYPSYRDGIRALVAMTNI